MFSVHVFVGVSFINISKAWLFVQEQNINPLTMINLSMIK